ncbi:MAG: LEA type 2 family protein [Treponema sp.]|nr:LEA type 2 family protein [Treponema sp.]
MKKQVCFVIVPLLFLLCLGVCSCRSFRAAFRQPVVSLGSADITGINLEGIQLHYSLEVENPNIFSLSFPEIYWTLFINGASFLSGVAPEGEAISPGSARTLDIPLNLAYTALVDAAGTSGGRELDYQLVVETRFLLPVQGELVRNFERQGKLPLVQMIALRNPAFEITALGFEGMDILCSLDVDNPNPFPIPFPGMNYDFGVRNNSFISGTVEHPDTLAAGGLTAVRIGLKVAYSDLYRSFSALKTLGEAACLLSLDSSVSLPGFDRERLFLDIPGVIPLLKEPVMSFKGISVKKISLSKIDFEFGWDVDNPNIFDFEMGDLRYAFLVNDSVWAQGRLEKWTKIAPGRKTPVPVTVSIESSAEVKDLTGIITRGMDVAYDLKGAAVFSAGPAAFADSHIPFDLNGRTRLGL